MSRAAITLGIGHPPDDLSGGTVWDVHLHLDCPEGPLSLGERCGHAPDVGAQYTLQQAAKREAKQLTACGCEWLVRLADEERQRGQTFTPEEILDRRPAPSPSPSPAPAARPKPASTVRPASETLLKIRLALQVADFEALERLRDVLTDEIVRQVARDWHALLPWTTKDAYAALLQDQTAACVQPIFRDALRSPTVETRAYALCVLTGDFSRFTSLLTDGWVDGAKVDAAIAAAGW